MAEENRKSRAVEVAGIIGVIVSLGFVGMEIRQNTTAVRAATIQAISDQAMELGLVVAEDEDLAELVARMVNDSLSADDLDIGEDLRLRVLVIAGFRRMENVFLQVEAGILEAGALNRASLSFYQNPYARSLWHGVREGGVRGNYDAGFASYWDSILGVE